MFRTCDKCKTRYDDALRFTFCPHDRFITDDEARRKDLAFKLLQSKVILPGQECIYHIRSICHDGLVALYDESCQRSSLDNLYDPRALIPIPAGKEEIKMDTLFEVHMLNESGKRKATEIAALFNALLDDLVKVCPPGRELSLVRTHLEIAGFYAKKSMAMQPENQSNS